MTASIRLARLQDAAQILDIYAPFVRHTVVSFELEVPTITEMESRIQATTAQYPWLVLEHQGMVAGYAYASAHRSRLAYQWSVDVSAYVHENYRRYGVGRALYTAAFAILVEQGYYNAYAGIALPNDASVGLHEAMGFTPIGVYQKVGYKLAAWHDVGWWHLALTPTDGEPSTPLAISTVIGTPVWETAIAAGQAFLRLPV